MRLFELFVEPRPRDENDLSGFTWRRFCVLELYISGLALQLYSCLLYTSRCV